jgi:hypothetical protein
MTFAYHITTHDYYNLMTIPIVALSMTPLVAIVAERISSMSPSVFARIVLAVGVATVTFTYMWYARVDLAHEDFREEASFWWDLGEVLGHTNPAIGMTQDYGYRLAYWGWQDVSSWYYESDVILRELAGENVDLTQRFGDQIKGKCYFVVTQFSRFNDQVEIRDLLYDKYPIYAKTDKYLIFQLAPCPSQ